MRVVVVEDVVTTGASALEAAAAVREAGGTVCGVLAVVDREEGGREAIERERLRRPRARAAARAAAADLIRRADAPPDPPPPATGAGCSHAWSVRDPRASVPNGWNASSRSRYGVTKRSRKRASAASNGRRRRNSPAVTSSSARRWRPKLCGDE